MSAWYETTIGDVITFQRGFDITRSKQRIGDIPVVSSGGVSSYHDTPMANGPGVVIGRKGTLGKVFYLHSDYWPHDTTLWIKDFKGNSPKFVYYFLQTINFLSMDVGSSNPTLNRNHVHPTRILWTSLSNQESIAATLSALDAKIAVNERITEASLDLAGQVYMKSSHSTKWKTTTLETAAKWFSGGTPDTSNPDFWGGEFPWISAKSLKSPLISQSERNLTELGIQSKTRTVGKDSVIFVVRGSSLKEEFRVGITQRDVAFGQDCKALVAHKSIDPHTLFHAIRTRTPEILNMVDETGIGAGRLSTDLISKLEIRIPASPEDETSSQLRLLDKQAASSQSESRTLTELRDTLLPQLMSGKLRVKDAEKIVEDNV